MKIHVVKKGDTLWEIAKQHNVDFKQLKEMNSQLSSPDMIMPGMKIKVPTNAKPVKKEAMKAAEKEKVKTPYKDISPKPLPVIKEDEKPIKEKPMMPTMPTQMPKMPSNPPVYNIPINDQDTYQFTNINVSQMEQPKKEVKHEKMKQMPMQHMPMQQMPMQQMPMQQMPMKHQHHMPVPMCCYPMYPMHPNQMHPNQMQPQQMHPNQMHPMHQMHPNQMHPANMGPMHMGGQKPMMNKHGGCGCSGASPQSQNQMMGMYNEMPEMDMPIKPVQHTNENKDMKNNYGGMYNKPKSSNNMRNGYGNPNPKPPGFQPFPMSSYRDDEEGNKKE
ncbi:LysM peptidoglycan-binding domain-containing protein [Virgibacillus flavescens]|uniref:LysM peptidoglycan-binding domain-containing protein n=1 Tax=Virgibacillus flavescens TaxID=1611422 RepID=UPI003D34D809